jgi:hypothetical protein
MWVRSFGILRLVSLAFGLRLCCVRCFGLMIERCPLFFLLFSVCRMGEVGVSVKSFDAAALLDTRHKL